MNLKSRSSTDPLHLNAPQQVGTVWLALAAVLMTLSLLFLAYGWRSYDFTAKRVQTQSQSRAELTRSQVFNGFRHMDDILLQTKSVYERAGPGIASQAGVLAQSSAPLGLSPYTCIAIVNAVGDAFFRAPDNCVLPDIGAKASEFQPMDGGAGRLLTDFFQGPEGLQVVRAVQLHYPDETFAGMVLGVLSKDYVFSVFKGFDPAAYQVLLETGGDSSPVLIAETGASASTKTIGVAKTVLEFEGFSGPVRLGIRSSVSRTYALEEWTESVIWPFLGYLLVFGGLVQGARVLTRALHQQMVSDLVAQRAQVEAEVQSRFIANISHEVRTPMNGVLGAARLLGKTTLSESQRQLLGLVERSGKVLLGTINDLLDIGKLREGQMALEQQPVNLIELLEDSCALQAPQAFAKGLDLIVTLDLPDRLGVVGDALRVQQVVTNLLNNAVKFTAVGTVHLSATLFCSQGGTHLKIEVCDTGIGINMAEADWLFQPFQQADASTARRFGGTGLGLAITDQLVRLMGGGLEVHSKPGEGTTFTAHWPLVLSGAQGQTQDPGKANAPQAAWGTANLLCELDLPDGPAAEQEQKALTCQLRHLGISFVMREARLQRPDSQHVMQAQVVLADESCLLQDRPEWLAQGVAILVLCREPGSFTLPPHLAGLDWKLIAKPARRSALASALSVGEAAHHEAAPLNFDPPDAEGVPAAGLLQGLHVLVAEDHAVNQILIKHTLQAAGCRVHLVPNGLLAIDALFGPESTATGPFDLVLMDCQMPQLDGLSATERIRQRESATRMQRVPIIAMTALAMPEDRQRCLDSGMDDYCSKPIDENILVEKVAKWARSIREPGLAAATPAYTDLAQGPHPFYRPSSDVR